ncbi:MAG: YbaK/EbsC family protein, partial [Nitriliruptor sp.]
ATYAGRGGDATYAGRGGDATYAGEERPVLVLTSGANRVDEHALAVVLGATSVRKADADEVRAVTGYAIGGTPPLGHRDDLAVVCDQDLLAIDEVWAAAGTPSTVFPIAPAQLVKVTGGIAARVAS